MFRPNKLYVLLQNKPLWLRYFIALSFVVLAFVLQEFVRAIVPGISMALLFPAIFLASWFCGLGPSLFAWGTSFFGMYIFFNPVPHSLDLKFIMRCVLFSFNNAIVIWLVNRNRHSDQKIEASWQRLQESESKLRIMANSAPVLIWSVGLDRTYNWFNQEWLNFTGQKISQGIRAEWANAIHPDDLPRALESFDKAFSERQEFKVEYRLLHCSGDYRWVLDHGIPHFSHEKFAGFIGACIDITEQKMLAQSHERAILARDEFISMASHELKTPITSIKLQMDMFGRSLAKGTLADYDLKRFHEISTRQLDRLMRLIEDMLNLAQIYKGKLNIEKHTMNLSEAVRDVVLRNEQLILSVSCKVEFDLAENVIGRWDQFRVDQIITNLLSNALKYAPGTTIAIEVTRKGNTAYLKISDRGIGISKADQSRIFGQFERAIHGRKISGLGIGLYIVDTIVKAHSGRVLIESEEGKGSVFTVELPIGLEEEAAIPKAAQEGIGLRYENPNC